MKKALYGLLICMALFLAACAEQELTDNAPAPAGIGLATQTNETYDFPEINSTITVGTLVLDGNGENVAVEKINDELAMMQQEYIERTKAIDASYVDQDSSLSFNHELKLQLVYSDEEVVSILALGYDENQYDPHPNIYRLGYVFSSQTGQKLGLADVLGEDFIPDLSQSIISDITAAKEQDNYYPGFEEQLAAILSEENWYIKDDLIYLIFNPYQISPPALGVLEFTYPYNS